MELVNPEGLNTEAECRRFAALVLADVIQLPGAAMRNSVGVQWLQEPFGDPPPFEAVALPTECVP